MQHKLYMRNIIFPTVGSSEALSIGRSQLRRKQIQVQQRYQLPLHSELLGVRRGTRLSRWGG